MVFCTGFTKKIKSINVCEVVKIRAKKGCNIWLPFLSQEQMVIKGLSAAEQGECSVTDRVSVY